jgi:hypothetical protein
MDFVGVFPATKKGHNYLFVIVDMCLAKCAISCLVRRPSRDRKKQAYYLIRFGCTLGYQGASSQIGTPYFEGPSGQHCGRRWTLISRGVQHSIHI